MKLLRITGIFCLFNIALMLSLTGSAQTNSSLSFETEKLQLQKRYGLNAESTFLSRIGPTPADIVKVFRDAGMSPTEHSLTAKEIQAINTAFAALPPVHQQVLKQHLKSISFMDNMPNTALTSPITDKEDFRLYHITFRAGIFDQSISDW